MIKLWHQCKTKTPWSNEKFIMNTNIIATFGRGALPKVEVAERYGLKKVGTGFASFEHVAMEKGHVPKGYLWCRCSCTLENLLRNISPMLISMKPPYMNGNAHGSL